MARVREACAAGQTQACVPFANTKEALCGLKGTQQCQSAVWGDCVFATQEEKGALCGDRIDNDCDGKTDANDDGCRGAQETCEVGKVEPCYTGARATLDKGPCKGGTRSCGADARWGPCQGEVTPQPEDCNGKDDDCDGRIDNGVGDQTLTKVCFNGTQGCTQEKEGKYTCVEPCTPGKSVCDKGAWGPCAGEVVPTAEACNGKDDDCDGKDDEGEDGDALLQECFSGQTGCQKQGDGTYKCAGPCKAGSQICTLGIWSACKQDTLPQREICRNKLDDDCDGNIDEGCTSCDPATLKYLGATDAHGDVVYSIAFNPNGSQLASGGRDKLVKVWELANDKLTEKYSFSGHKELAYHVAYHPDGKTLASGSHDNKIRIWSLSLGGALFTFDDSLDNVRAVAFHPAGIILAATGYDTVIRLFDMKQVKQIQTLREHTKAVHTLAYSPDGTILASGGSDDKIVLWDVASGKIIRTLTDHGADIRSVSFGPEGKLLASGSVDKTVKIWDVDNGKVLYSLLSHSAIVTSVAFNPNGQNVASVSDDKTVKIWDVNKGVLLRTMTDATDKLRTVAYSPDGQVLAVAGADKTIKLWKCPKE